LKISSHQDIDFNSQLNQFDTRRGFKKESFPFPKYSCPNCSSYPERNHNIVQLQNGNTRALKKCNIYQHDLSKNREIKF